MRLMRSLGHDVPVRDAIARGQSMSGHETNAVIMNEGGDDDETVEKLVRLEPNVAFAGEKALGNSHGVEQRTADVENRHENEPTQSACVEKWEKKIRGEKMSNCNSVILIC